jgi:hypothetical protein
VFCFATLCIVAPPIRGTLDVLPMDVNGSRAKRGAVCSLVETTREYVSIWYVYLDRGFYQVHVVAELEQLDVDYIVRARPSSGMKGRLSAGAKTVVDSYMMQRKAFADSVGGCYCLRGATPFERRRARLVRGRCFDSKSVRGGGTPPLGHRNVLPPDW